MKVLKNIEVAKRFNVSEPTVSKWIDDAINHKNRLDISINDKKPKIYDTEDNEKELLSLKENGQKFKNKNLAIPIKPKDDLFNIFSSSQLIEIVLNLKKKLLQTKFTYFAEGAHYWDDYVTNLIRNENDITKGLETINASLDYLSLRLNKYEIINIIDIGPGNGYTAKALIEKLKDLGINATYTAMDISQEMLKILNKNFKDWFPNIDITSEIGDVDYYIIRDILYRSKTGQNNSCNLIMFLGCTIGNFIDRSRILNNFSNSMGVDDYLLIDAEIKTPKDYQLVNRHLNLEPIKNIDFWLLDKLGIKEEFYELNVQYVKEIDSQAHVFTIKQDLEIIFDNSKFKDKVFLKKGDTIIAHMVHSFHLNEIIDDIQNASLNISHLSCYPDKSEVFIMCEAE